MFGLGDQNNDGYADFAVSGYERTGQLALFHGGNPPAATPYLTLGPDSTVYGFYGGQTLGDVTGDGYIDWYILSEAPQHTFRWAFYFGGPAADTIPDALFLTPHTIPHEVYLQPAGDFNGDGIDDIYAYDQGSDSGFVYYGGNPFDTLSDWTCQRTAYSQTLPQGHGDLNGDGYSDFISQTIGTTTTQLWVFHGGASPARPMPTASWARAAAITSASPGSSTI